MQTDALQSGFRVQAAPSVPVARLALGRDPDEVAALLPRVFNLCRAAQAAAAMLALGREADWAGAAQELMRDHLLKLCISVPSALGQAPEWLPQNWRAGGAGLIEKVIGAPDAPPTPEAFETFLEGDSPLALTVRSVADAFAPGEAVVQDLPLVDSTLIWSGGPIENSVAARHADHPVMREIADCYGRGPLWRLVARLYDLCDVAHDRLPAPEVSPGRAVVVAARGSYALEIGVEAGRVARLSRITPTDALLARGGILEQSLQSLPTDKAHLAPLLMEILDPCSPVTLQEVPHA